MEGTIWLRARRIDFAIVISDSSTYRIFSYDIHSMHDTFLSFFSFIRR